jgi:acetyl esterase/lipase
MVFHLRFFQKNYIIIALSFYITSLMAQKPLRLSLYQGAIPNSIASENREVSKVNEWKVLFTTEISEPSLTMYAAKKPNGKAVIICPGGGYVGTADDHEGVQVAKKLARWGVTAFVLKYRLPDDRYCVDKSLAPLQDAQQAIRLVRKRAAEWHINANEIGIMGFSAGGHLAATASTHFQHNADAGNTDTTSVRPDFSILVYPVISFHDSLTHAFSRERLLGKTPTPAQIALFSNELQVTTQTPRTFLVHAQDDDAVKVENSLDYYRACRTHHVPTEMHLYPKGGHGFGMNNPTTKDAWMERLRNWL